MALSKNQIHQDNTSQFLLAYLDTAILLMPVFSVDILLDQVAL